MNRRHGYLHWVFPAIIAFAALEVLLSGRNLSAAYSDVVKEMVRAPAVAWAQRFVSILLLAASAERIVSHFARREAIPSPTLMLGFIVFWLGSVAAPAFYGTHPKISHDYAYPLVFGIALAMARPADGDKVVEGLRNALLVFMLAGCVLIPLQPTLVLDAKYAGGLLSGLPRFAGLAAHAVTMGTLSLTALLCLWHRPYRRRWLNLAAWLLGLSALFLAQSKTGWIAFMLGAGAILSVRHAATFWRRLGDSRNNSFGILVCTGFMIVVVGVMVVLMLGIAEEKIASFLHSAQGAQLVTMTGRDQIWGIAMEEWRQNWWFGYGPTLWDDTFRNSIGMPYATHAHNQLMDTLARSGIVGAASLVVYSILMLVLSLRYASATRGLSLALFLGLAMYSVSEVPLLLFGFGAEVTQLLLIATIASAAAARLPVAVQVPTRLRTAS